MKKRSLWREYSYLWVTAVFFVGSLVGHWAFGWAAFVDEQAAHGQPPQFSEYFIQAMRDTLENWQSEFLQLIWQVGGLAALLYIGSPQSKNEDERLEEKIDHIMRSVSKDADDTIRKLDAKYYRV